MSFLNLPVLALGGLLVAGPIILHLMMQRKPKHLLFPALRFLQRRQVTNTRRVRIRHWALLALRCLAVLGLAIALARPIVASAALGSWLLVGGCSMAALVVGGLALFAKQRHRGAILATGLGGLAAALMLGGVVLGWQALQSNAGQLPLGDVEAAVAAVLLFDTSPRMGLVYESQTRLERAQELGKWLLRQLPQDSQIAIMDSRLGGSAFAVDRIAAANEIDGLATGYAAQPLPRMVAAAEQLLQSSSLEQHEIYVLGDLTAGSWPAEATPQDPSAEDETKPLVYIIDVGVTAPQNLSLGGLRLSRQHIAQNSQLDISIDVHSEGLAATRLVQLYVESPDPSLPMIVNGQPKLPEQSLRDQREVTLASDESQTLDFSIRGLPVGTHHGEIRLTGSDGLSVDDTRYFSIEVHPPWPLLIVAGPGAQPKFLQETLAPYQFRETGQAMFTCDIIEPQGLAQVDTTKYAAIALLDPPPLPSYAWRMLADYVSTGGGLAVFLGRNAEVEGFTSSEARAVLPANIVRVWRAGVDDILLSFGAEQHPILKILEPMATSIPWEAFPIQRHWLVDDLATHGSVVMRFGHGKPALIEGHIGSGHVMMMTTPVSDPLNVRGRRPWNRGTDSWPYVVLINEIMKYLVQGAAAQLDYRVGQTAHLPHRRGEEDKYQLFLPQSGWQQVAVNKGDITVTVTDVPGTFRLKPDAKTDPPLGFSVNLPVEATNLERIDSTRLDDIFGVDAYRIATDKNSIDRSIGVARRGHEFYPWAMLLVVLVLGLEHLLSNLFYSTNE